MLDTWTLELCMNLIESGWILVKIQKNIWQNQIIDNKFGLFGYFSWSLKTLGTEIVVALVAVPNSIIVDSLAFGTAIAGVRVVIILRLDFLWVRKNIRISQWFWSGCDVGCKFCNLSTAKRYTAYSSGLHYLHISHIAPTLGSRSVIVSLRGLGTAFIKEWYFIIITKLNLSSQISLTKLTIILFDSN